MALVILSAFSVRTATLAAEKRLRPGADHWRSAWAEEHYLLSEMQRAADQAIAIQSGNRTVALTLKELDLIRADLT